VGDRGLKRRGGAPSLSIGDARSRLNQRLRERQSEIRSAIATRIYAISDPREVADPAYLQRLNDAIDVAIDHRLAVLESGERNAPPVPPELLAQARLDARDNVPLETVLRRYFAGNALFGDFLVEEAERADVSSSSLRRLLAVQATVFDRLIATISAEHARQAQSRPAGTAERRRECVKRLLAGELVDGAELGYDLDAKHLALMAKGREAPELMRRLARRLDRRLLIVRREEEPTWACWLGGERPLAVEEAVGALEGDDPEGVVVAIGEGGEGLPGWRFSHLQAKAALQVAERSGRRLLRYAEVALLSPILRDELAASSMHRLYIEPLEDARDGGQVAKETLRAYFAAERNISSTAAALGVDRHTVRNRLRAIEGLLGRPLGAVATDLEVALRLSHIVESPSR
jgi:hypothetical protein